jgi:hypothetical protein
VFNPCFPGKGVKNAFFIDIPPTNITVGTLAAAEGWYGEDEKFYAFLIEGEGSVKDQSVSVGIARPQCRNRGGTRGLEWEIRGGVGVPVGSGRERRSGREDLPRRAGLGHLRQAGGEPDDRRQQL